MIAFLSIALFSTVSAAALDDAETARVAYSNCLVDFTTAQLDEKTGTSAFKKAATTACSDERNAMISALKKDEMEFGSSDSEATSFATEEADGVLFSFTDGYAGYASSSTRPVKEE
ncbi:hypothetical protein [Sphingorhabdus sp. M41]|uniref:hypothetical protein n=1 Tax=Sphingorhabdus sp. M41 TaxID=1806885 RepID=UPI00078B9BFB|nr:hypothetical protein [Sphingorhabdus sp. M41]AMO71773.1 hypothetical protein AZE99_07820 [Sphingorhabdus sp. M41]